MSEPSGTRLDSWKSIAQYLQRNERTAMRWAEERGLPVHRVPGGKRGAVFAFTTEIDQWLVSQNDRRVETGAVTAANTEGQSTKLRLPAKAVGLGLGLVALVTLAGALRPASRHARRIESAALRNDLLEAHDVRGDRVWSYQFPQRLAPSFRGAMASEPLPARVADFFGDGDHEIAALVTFAAGRNGGEFPVFAVDFFSNSGSLLWSYEPQLAFRFAEHELKGPWEILELATGGEPGPATLWAAMGHHTWGNTAVVQLDPRTGRDELRFVNTGVIYRVREVKTGSDRYLLAGGFNNEWDAASLAIINEKQPFAASPQTPGTRHYCDSCPPGSPDYYFVFPRSELNRAEGAYLHPVLDIVAGDEGIEIRTYEREGGGKENIVYLLGAKPPFELLSVRHDSSYDSTHRQWSASGKLRHPLDKCPERLHPAPVRLWTPKASWTEIVAQSAQKD